MKQKYCRLPSEFIARTHRTFAIERQWARCSGSVGILALLAFGCSWTRFDDVMERSPVQILEAPGDLGAIGKSVSAIRGATSTFAFSTGSDGFALFEFAEADVKSAEAVNQGSCSAANGCWLTQIVAAAYQDVSAVVTPCFAFGVEAKPAEPPRALLYCDGDLVRGLVLPDPPPAEMLSLGPTSPAPRITFASGPRLTPDLLVGAMPDSSSVWFYPVATTAPVAIGKPSLAGKSFGSTLAVAASETHRFIVVGEPDAGNVYLLRTDGTASPDAALCISGGMSNFGSALATGHFTSAASSDLAVGSDDAVVVIPALDSLPLTAAMDAPCVDLAALSIGRSLSCSELNSGNACERLLAQVALAATDLDGDGLEELLVGTPGASTRGNDAAGKILITTFGREAPAVLEELSPSSIESGDRLGTSIVGVPLARPEVVLAGAPGGNKLAAFFCTSLLTKDQGGARCD